jgi:hypothetical protein
MSVIERTEVRLMAGKGGTLNNDRELPAEIYTGDLWMSAGQGLMSATCLVISRHSGDMSFLLIGICAACAAAWPLWNRLTGKYS